MADQGPPLELRADYGVDGDLVRELFTDTFRVGDTVSAVLLPSRFSTELTWWPPHFTVLRRRVQPAPDRAARTTFGSLSADADGYAIGAGSLGLFVADVEDQLAERDHPGAECYAAGATVHGSLNRALRIPRMR